MPKIRLGVNIDHVATIRNARGESYPDPLKAALLAEKYGANSVTIHLREDRRHINDLDLKRIVSKLKIPLNLEIAATKEMLKSAIKYKPKYICIVPEKRQEITTEGGLNLKFNKVFLKKMISKLKQNGSRVSLFLEPRSSDILLAKHYFNCDCIEIHTGKICNLINFKKNYKKEYVKITKVSKLAYLNNLDVHAGHGLNYESAKVISKVKYIRELNIGHFLIGDSIFNGLKKTIQKFKKLL